MQLWAELNKMCRLLRIHATSFYHFDILRIIVRYNSLLSSVVGGSFRQFLWQAAKEISGPLLRLLIPCNNSDKKGRYIFRPGPMSFSEERLLQFFGQVRHAYWFSKYFGRVHWLKICRQFQMEYIYCTSLCSLYIQCYSYYNMIFKKGGKELWMI